MKRKNQKEDSDTENDDEVFSFYKKFTFDLFVLNIQIEPANGDGIEQEMNRVTNGNEDDESVSFNQFVFLAKLKANFIKNPV